MKLMRKPYLVITNNPKVPNRYGERFRVEYREGDYLSVLLRARDAIHEGHRLMTHPLAGSLKPNQTPFRSVMLSEEKEGGNWDDILLIENSIAAYHKFTAGRPTPIWTEAVRNDFATIDLSLVDSAAGTAMICRR